MPLTTATAIAIYITIWWTVLFAVLPFARAHRPEGEAEVAGADPGAPGRPRLLFAALVTTGVSVAVFAALLAYIALAA